MSTNPSVRRRIALSPGWPLAGMALALALVAAAPVRIPAQAAAPAIPARLTDQEFWKLISDISEPGGYFRSDNFVSNEIGFQRVIPELQRTLRPGLIYLGVGPEQNFTYIAALQPKMAIIFDIRRGNLHAHLLYKALFEMAADRAEFISLAFSQARPKGLDSTVTADSIFNAFYLVPTDSLLYKRNLAAVREHLVKTRHLPLATADLEGIEYVYYALYWCGSSIHYSCTPYANRSGFGGRGNSMPAFADLMVQDDGRGVQRSFLATEATFRTIKEMHQKNLIVPVVGDFAGPKAIRAVGQYLRERNATVGAIYVSNVEQYLFQQGNDWREYYDNVATLPLDSASMFIRSIGGNRGGAGFGRLPSVLSSVRGLLTAYREGRITGYYDVIQMSR
jgi:hypothetical protein